MTFQFDWKSTISFSVSITQTVLFGSRLRELGPIYPPNNRNLVEFRGIEPALTIQFTK
jgi:hypothetical protein